MSKHNFKELKVWQKAVDLAVWVYNETQNFPTEEKFGLVSQMRRSSVSISSNIAEGAGRTTNKDFSKFLDHSIGSSNELFTQMIISEKVGLLTLSKSAEVQELIEEIVKMTLSLKLKLKEV